MRSFLFSCLMWLACSTSLNAQVGYQWNMYPETQSLSQEFTELELPAATTYPGFDLLINIQRLNLLRGPVMASPASIMLPGTAPQPFFCRMEWMAEQQLNFPIRVRLGDVDYVDWLEGKGFRN